MDDIDRYLDEDLGKEGDITSDALFNEEKASAIIVANENCVVAGLDEMTSVFKKTGANVRLLVNDGVFIKEKTIVAEINGLVRSILRGERLALNFICKMSGIATETKKLVDICKSVNPKVKVAATRKTTPGFRKYEKKAIILGGGESHRFGLYDAVMIKDNHLKCKVSLGETIKQIQDKIQNKTIEVEVENEKDALTAAKMGVDVIMLDNFDSVSGKKLAEKIKKINPSILIEISGGIIPDNIVNYASFADRISLGYLTHSSKNIDFSLEINRCF